MKTLKWIYRYSFFGLMLSAFIAWYVYCRITIEKLNEFINSFAFIDLALESPLSAREKLLRLELFEGLKISVFKGIIFLAVCTLLLIISHIVFPIISKKLANRKPKEKKSKVKKQAFASEDALSNDMQPNSNEATEYNTTDNKTVFPEILPNEETEKNIVTEEISPLDDSHVVSPQGDETVSLDANTHDENVIISKIESDSSNTSKSEKNDETVLIVENKTENISDTKEENNSSDSKEQKVIFCSKCGKKYESKPKFCAKCGHEFK